MSASFPSGGIERREALLEAGGAPHVGWCRRVGRHGCEVPGDCLELGHLGGEVAAGCHAGPAGPGHPRGSLVRWRALHRRAHPPAERASSHTSRPVVPRPRWLAAGGGAEPTWWARRSTRSGRPCARPGRCAACAGVGSGPKGRRGRSSPRWRSLRSAAPAALRARSDAIAPDPFSAVPRATSIPSTWRRCYLLRDLGPGGGGGERLGPSAGPHAIDDQALLDAIDRAELGADVEAELRAGHQRTRAPCATWSRACRGCRRSRTRSRSRCRRTARRPTAPLGPATITVDCPIATVTVAGERIPIGLLPPPARRSRSTPARRGAPGRSSSTVTRCQRFPGSCGSASPTSSRSPCSTPRRHTIADARAGRALRPPVQLSFGFALDRGRRCHRRQSSPRRRRSPRPTCRRFGVRRAVPDRPEGVGTGGVRHTRRRCSSPRPGQHVVGPTVTITWLDLGAFSLVRLDLGVLLSIPVRRRHRSSDRGQIQLPPVLQIRLDVLGVIDPGRSIVSIDACSSTPTFSGSSTSPAPPRCGCAGAIIRTSCSPSAASTPASARARTPATQQRLALNLAVPCPITLHADGYSAITAEHRAGGRPSRGDRSTWR